MESPKYNEKVWDTQPLRRGREAEASRGLQRMPAGAASADDLGLVECLEHGPGSRLDETLKDRARIPVGLVPEKQNLNVLLDRSWDTEHGTSVGQGIR